MLTNASILYGERRDIFTTYNRIIGFIQLRIITEASPVSRVLGRDRKTWRCNMSASEEDLSICR